MRVWWEVWKLVEADDMDENDREYFVGECDNSEDADHKAREIRGRGFEAWVEREDDSTTEKAE
jgi:hypothetical protein